MSEKLRAWLEKAGAGKYILLAAALGILLLLWPSGSGLSESDGRPEEEVRLESILSGMEGVGPVELLLSEKGAVVVCQGAEDAGVCLRITRAVRCYTGLGADKVQIFKMK